MDNKEFNALVEKYKQELMETAKRQSPYLQLNVSDNTTISNPQIYGETYQQFIDRNNKQGELKIQAFSAQQAIPVSGVNVKISKKFSDQEKVFFEGTTDDSGIIDGIFLPAPDKELSEHPENSAPYATYNITASHPIYGVELTGNVQVFGDTKAIQPIRVIPTTNNNA